jgi:hypothetical protein
LLSWSFHEPCGLNLNERGIVDARSASLNWSDRQMDLNCVMEADSTRGRLPEQLSRP